MMKWKRNEDEAEAQHKQRHSSSSSCSSQGGRESGALPDGYVMTERGVLQPAAEEESTTSSLTIEDAEETVAVRRQAASITSSVLADVSRAALAARVALSRRLQASRSRRRRKRRRQQCAQSPNTLGSGGRSRVPCRAWTGDENAKSPPPGDRRTTKSTRLYGGVLSMADCAFRRAPASRSASY